MQTSLMPAPDQPQQAVGQRQIACGKCPFPQAIQAAEGAVMNTALLTGRAAAMARIKGLVLDSLPSPESRRAYSRALDDFLGWCSPCGQSTHAPRQ